MDFIFLLLTSFTLLKTPATGCKDALMVENKSCFDSYKTYLANLGNSGADTSQIVLLLCNEEGKAITKCLKPLLDECKELKEDPIYQIFHVLEAMGGCGSSERPMQDEILIEGGLTTDESEGRTDHTLQNASTKFIMFLEESKLICREFEAELGCLKKYEKECPINGTGEDKNITLSSPSIASNKDSLWNQCPTFPEDYFTNECLRKHLMTKRYINCYKNATNNVTETELTCDQYKSAYNCVDKELKTCGAKYITAFTTTINIYLAALFKNNCQVAQQDEKSKKTSGAIVDMLSLYIMVICAFLVIFV